MHSQCDFCTKEKRKRVQLDKQCTPWMVDLQPTTRDIHTDIQGFRPDKTRVVPEIWLGVRWVMTSNNQTSQVSLGQPVKPLSVTE